MNTDISKLSDEEVVKIVRTSDKEMYAEIIRRYQNKLIRYTRYILGDEHKGADAVQEAFIKAYINLNGFDTAKKFSSWIYRITHNEAIRVLRTQKKQVPMDEALAVDRGISLEDEAIKNDLIGHAHHCLERIPVMYSEPLSLVYLEEKSYEEISDILRIPVGTVGTRVARAKHILKKLCQNLRR